MKNGFPGLRVERALVDVYTPGQKGFNVFAANSDDILFIISCYSYDLTNATSLAMIDTPGHWKIDAPGEFLFAIKPQQQHYWSLRLNCRETVYRDVKKFDWIFEGQNGCSFGYEDMTNALFCIGDGIRLIFEAPEGRSSPLSEASNEELESAVLKEILFWP